MINKAVEIVLSKMKHAEDNGEDDQEEKRRDGIVDELLAFLEEKRTDPSFGKHRSVSLYVPMRRYEWLPCALLNRNPELVIAIFRCNHQGFHREPLASSQRRQFVHWPLLYIAVQWNDVKTPSPFLGEHLSLGLADTKKEFNEGIEVWLPSERWTS